MPEPENRLYSVKREERAYQRHGQKVPNQSQRSQQKRTQKAVPPPMPNLPGSYRQSNPFPKESKQTAKLKVMRSASPTAVKSQKSRAYSSAAAVATDGAPQRRSLQGQRPRRLMPVIYLLRLVILGVGIGAIAGTLLAAIEPANRIKPNPALTPNLPKLQTPVVAVSQPQLPLNREIQPLKTFLQQLAAKNSGLTPGVFFFDLDSGNYVELNSGSTFSAASLIKFPVAIAFFQDVDAGKIRLDEMLTLEPQLIGGGSGVMQYQHPWTKFTALETLTKMITISDNTATNLLIARMGGAAAINQRFQSWGLNTTQIHNWLPDLSGTNTTSPRDLANLMSWVNQGNLISTSSRNRLFDIMRHTTINTLLTPGLGPGATIAHKTGDIGSLVGDVGLVSLPSGKRYIAVAMVKRPYNDSRAQELIRQISHAVYQQFSQAVVAPTKLEKQLP